MGKYIEFDLASDGMTLAQADELMAVIIAWVEAHHLSIGGAYREREEPDNEQEKSR